MAILLTCACGKQFRAKDEFAGKTMKCRHCGVTLVIPDAASGNSSGDALGATPRPQSGVTTPSQVGRTPMPSERVASKPGLLKPADAGIVSSTRLARKVPAADPLANTGKVPRRRRGLLARRQMLLVGIAVGVSLFLVCVFGFAFYLWWGQTYDVDVGNPLFKGKTTQTDTRSFDMSAGGTDIWEESDQFHFRARRIVGDFDLQVCIRGIEGPDVQPWTKAGLMARDNLDPKSAHISILATPKSGYCLQRRPFAGGKSSTFPIDTSKAEQCPWPTAWLRLRREGDDFTGYTSPDGRLWTKLNKMTVKDFPRVAYVGLAATAHKRDQSVLVHFTEFGKHE